MTDPDSAEREDPRLQADPLLTLSDGQATVGQELFGRIAAVVVVLATLYGLTHQGGDALRSATVFQIAGAVLPDTVGQGRR